MDTLFLFAFSLLLLLHAAEAMNGSRGPCERTFACGSLQEIKFPFVSTQMPSNCGLFRVNCSAKVPEVQLEEKGKWYEIESISQANTMKIVDLELRQALISDTCSDLSAFRLPNSRWLKLNTVCKCNRTSISNLCSNGFTYNNCRKDNTTYTSDCDAGAGGSFLVPESWVRRKSQSTTNISSTFFVNTAIPRPCFRCHYRGGSCSFTGSGKFQCIGGAMKDESRRTRMELGVGIGGAFVLVLASLFIFLRFFRRRKASDSISRTNSSYPFSGSDIETSHVLFKVPVFPFKELEEATDNFSADRLLGDGGFGTVYFGKLRDGREIAVKRLYEHNYRRVQQFMTEIEILTRLHHRNLVCLYGCTSRRSRELLLVYEFVPNGTVADHLHGDLSKPGSLPWSYRMSIAIETASALAYLHASDIIHRDVKTTNILLDKNFNVKVADFGLSRLLPNDVTHVSTAPQGTPGYVDPEYHQYYHLTDKSDVYSFGVVLIELISSKPAVDMARSKTEINLSSLAVTKIQNHELDELIDPNLGCETDEKIRNMTKTVAELAFRCLQQQKEMRPTMDQVLNELQRICEENQDQIPTSSPVDWTEASLLKNTRFPPSPVSVTEQWVSKSTISNSSV